MVRQKRKENAMISIRSATIVQVLAVVTLAWGVHTDEVTVESMPPSVVRTVPQSGDMEVPATTREIQVTFSKDMMTERMWSWSMVSPATFPRITNQQGIRYLEDNRTCILPVHLEPGKTYAIWINTQQQDGFRDTSGNPSVPYLLVFRTKQE